MQRVGGAAVTENQIWALYSFFFSMVAFGIAGTATYQLATGDWHGVGIAVLGALAICLGLIHLAFVAVRFHWILAAREGR